MIMVMMMIIMIIVMMMMMMMIIMIIMMMMIIIIMIAIRMEGMVPTPALRLPSCPSRELGDVVFEGCGV